MNGELFRLSLQSIRRKRRSSLLLFAVLLLSFAFAIISLTVTGSMQKTNQEYRYDVYGEWYGAIPNGWEADEAFLREQEWLDRLGITKSYGTIEVNTSGSTSIGVMDDGFLEVGRIGLQDGHFPETAEEVAMEADLLSALGYDYTLGQEITVTVDLPATVLTETEDSTEPNIQSVSVPVERTYTLCGVLREYSDLWVRGVNQIRVLPLNSAMISPEGADALWHSAQEAIGETFEGSADISLDEPIPQYYFSILPGQEKTMQEKFGEYLQSTRTVSTEWAVTLNTAADFDEEEAAQSFYTMLILAVTLLAVVCIYAIQIQDEARQLAIFRSIGITKRQLCMMLLYETLCLGIPAMLLGVGVGALGTWTLLQLAVYSGSAPVQVVVPSVLLAATAVLWLLGVLLARLIVFLVALRAPLTGRFTMARKKAKRYSNLRRGFIAALCALLCATVVFTVVESLEPLHQVHYMSALPDYSVCLTGWAPYNSQLGYSLTASSTTGAEGYFMQDMTVPKSAAVLIAQVPGVTDAWGWGYDYVRLDFDGMDDVPMVAGYKECLRNTLIKGDFPYGIGTEDRDAMVAFLTVVDEGDWEGIIDFDTIDREKFRSGETVLMSFQLSANGKPISFSDPENYYLNEFNYDTKKEYEETGVSVGDTVSITVGTPQIHATTEVRIGGILYYSPEANWGALTGLNTSYTVLCSEAFLEKLLDPLGPKVAWNEHKQGTPYGYEQIYIYTDQNADYLSTDTILAELCVREKLLLMTVYRELKLAAIQQNTQTLILVFSGGLCAVLVLMLILWNTLSMEAERQKRDIGIQQALGMSRRQVNRWQFGTAALRGVLGMLIGWLAYGGYCVIDAVREQKIRQLEGRLPQTVWELLEQKILEITRFWGSWQIILPLTALCIVLVLAVSWLAKRRLMKEDLMAKLRDEH